MPIITKFMWDNGIKPVIVGLIQLALKGMFTNADAKLAEISDAVGIMPDSWYGGRVWNAVAAVTGTVVVPVAAMILTAVMCIELISWINEQNNLRSSSDVIAKLTWFIVKLGVGSTLVYKAHDLTFGVFELGAYLATPGGLHAGTANLDIEGFCASLLGPETTAGDLIMTLFTVLIAWGITNLIALLVQIIVMGRIIEIILYCSMGAIPYATLMNRELSGIGQNYLKNLFALAFQGFFILIILVIYGALTQALLTGAGDPKEAIVRQLLCSGALLMTVLQSKPFAKSIFNAH